MLKYLLLVLLIIFVLRAWQKRSSTQVDSPRREMPPERMVVCAQCGVHMPLSDSIAEGGNHYCCEVHRRTGPAADFK